MPNISPWWIAAAVAFVVAVFAGWRDYRRKHRDDLDRIGVFEWRTVQMFALIVFAISAGIAVKG